MLVELSVVKQAVRGAGPEGGGGQVAAEEEVAVGLEGGSGGGRSGSALRRLDVGNPPERLQFCGGALASTIGGDGVSASSMCRSGGTRGEEIDARDLARVAGRCWGGRRRPTARGDVSLLPKTCRGVSRSSRRLRHGRHSHSTSGGGIALHV